MKEMWDEKYTEAKHIYGIKPNSFFESELIKLNTGRVLLPGDGEGRNAAFASKLGWKVDSFDYSEQAVRNAKVFLSEQGVTVNCFQASILDLVVSDRNFDAVGVFYLHLAEDDRSKAHQFISNSVAKGGHLIVEVFSKKQLGRSSGGPKNDNLLYDISEFEHDFPEFEPIYIEELEVDLDEGKLHQGKAMVIRFVGKKK